VRDYSRSPVATSTVVESTTSRRSVTPPRPVPRRTADVAVPASGTGEAHRRPRLGRTSRWRHHCRRRSRRTSATRSTTRLNRQQSRAARPPESSAHVHLQGSRSALDLRDRRVGTLGRLCCGLLVHHHRRLHAVNIVEGCDETLREWLRHSSRRLGQAKAFRVAGPYRIGSLCPRGQKAG
jgi:hypothetical protein